MSIPFVFSNGSLTVVLKDKAFNIHKDDPKFIKVRDGLKNMTEDELFYVVNNSVSTIPVVIKDSNVVLDDVVLNGTTVYHKGKPVEKCLNDAVLNVVREGLPVDGILKFISRLYKNVSHTSRNQLLGFVERNKLTVDSEGFIIAYKAVRKDYKDKHSGTIDYLPGNTVSMDRGDVDDNTSTHCSKGLHCGALEYIYGFGSGDDRIVIVRVDPMDVVSVPNDYNCQKLRTCKLFVIGDYNGELTKPVYNATDNVEDIYRDDYEDDDDDDFDWEEVEDNDEDSDMYDDDYDSELDEDEEKEVMEDYLNSQDVQVTPGSSSGCVHQCGNCGSTEQYGVKPSGHRYFNKRGPNGKFCK